MTQRDKADTAPDQHEEQLSNALAAGRNPGKATKNSCYEPDDDISSSPARSSDAAGSSGFSSSILAQSPEDAITTMFDQRLQLLAATLETLRCKCELLNERLVESQATSSSYAGRLARSEEAGARLRAEAENFRDRELRLRQDVSRLEALLEAGRLQSAFTEQKLQHNLLEERTRSERLRGMRDDALLQRDEALGELSVCFADLDAMQATLADSALYVRYLRKRMLDLELEAARQTQQQAAQRQPPGNSDSGSSGSGGAFSLASIRTAIQAAVAEAATCGDEERRKRVRQLQLRWHPDKNPVLTEFATEVTKIINEAVEQVDAQGGPRH